MLSDASVSAKVLFQSRSTTERDASDTCDPTDNNSTVKGNLNKRFYSAKVLGAENLKTKCDNMKIMEMPLVT